MSFVDLMADDAWSEADIVRRTEAMVRAEFSAERETILNRKVSGAIIGTYEMTEADQAEVEQFQQVTLAAKLAGNQARADMALLAEVLALEVAQRRLDQPVVDAQEDAQERAAAQAVLDAASPAALDLLELRSASRGEVDETATDSTTEEAAQ